MKILENVPLAPLTSFGIGGPARWLAEAATEDDLIDAVSWARDRSLPLFILGGGSNLLVADAGFPGLVLRVALKGISSRKEDFSRVYTVAAGENWDTFVQKAVEDGSAGIECLAGIPGTVGGTPVQNVGAYGQDVSETIEKVRVLDLEPLTFHDLEAKDCGFAYRSSIFNSTAKRRFLVASVDYRLKPGGNAKLDYADLQKFFPSGTQPTLAQVAKAVRTIRKSKGMLLVEGDPDCRCAGSFFKNPILPAETVELLAHQLGQSPPAYPVADGRVKVSAAWLIERAGFPKGFRLGNAGISTRHTLALVNLGNARAEDILALRDLIKERLLEFGIALQMEPVLLGF
jgi:UDP-N-acetylmuramate dehydrogenase